ncbi:unnamed protein product [Moneuplotes crassus]|uniref:DUSP domain-containing protein n=1 Tax=Euplotes crassus TaxID=5936 RepID=A0AAD1X8A1_EUPCR|nr:unnamed protein product [Moneuplotes crassus]
MPKVDNDDCYIEDNFTYVSEVDETLEKSKEILRRYFESLFEEKEKSYVGRIRKLEQRVEKLQQKLEMYRGGSNRALEQKISKSEKFDINLCISAKKPQFWGTNARQASHSSNVHVEPRDRNKIGRFFEYQNHKKSENKRLRSKRFRKKRRTSVPNSICENVGIKPKLAKLCFSQTAPDMSAQIVPTTYISNKNNDKFATLINCDLSSDDDISVKRNTVANQEFKTNLNLKSLSNNMSDSHPELNFDSGKFGSLHYSDCGDIPSLHKIDTDAAISAKQCSCVNKCKPKTAKIEVNDSFSSELGSYCESSISENQHYQNNQCAPCSPYCINLSPSCQKKIIYMSISFMNFSQECPIYYNGISSEWWQKWCDYVNVEFFNPIDMDSSSLENILKSFKTNGEKSMRTGCYLKNSRNFETLENDTLECQENSINQNIFDEICRNDIAENELLSSCTSLMYTKPGKISNKDISEFNPLNQMVNLKKEMTEIYDYVLINSKGWEYLENWYGCDNPVYIPVQHM